MGDIILQTEQLTNGFRSVSWLLTDLIYKFQEVRYLGYSDPMVVERPQRWA